MSSQAAAFSSASASALSWKSSTALVCPSGNAGREPTNRSTSFGVCSEFVSFSKVQKNCARNCSMTFVTFERFPNKLTNSQWRDGHLQERFLQFQEHQSYSGTDSETASAHLAGRLHLGCPASRRPLRRWFHRAGREPRRVRPL